MSNAIEWLRKRTFQQAPNPLIRSNPLPFFNQLLTPLLPDVNLGMI